MKIVTIVLLVLGLMTVTAVPASATVTLDYRYWYGLQSPAVLELRIEPKTSRWGLRAWGASGYEEGWLDRFAGVDLTYRTTPHSRAYVGWQRIARTMGVEGYQNQHEGFRLGVMGSVPLRARLSAVYDVAWIPTDHFTGIGASEAGYGSGTGSGWMYRYGLRYAVSPQVAVEVGQWNFNFRLPVMGTHLWEGAYLGIGITR